MPLVPQIAERRTTELGEPSHAGKGDRFGAKLGSWTSKIQMVGEVVGMLHNDENKTILMDA